VNKQSLMEDQIRVLEPAMGSLGAALETTFKRPTEVQMGELHPVDSEELQSDYSEELVIATARFAEGLSDEIAFLVSPDTAAVWGNLVLEGEGEAEFSPEKHLDPVAELLNQLDGALCQYLTERCGSPVKLEPVEAKLGSVVDHIDKWISCFRADLVVKVEGSDESKMTLLLSSQTVDDLGKYADEGSGTFEDRPPPAVLDEEMDKMENLDGDAAPEVRPARFEDFGATDGGGSHSPQQIDALMDLELPVIIELGRTSMFIRDILELSPGSIVELNKLSGEPVDLYINDKKFAQGEVVVIDENFGIRITDLVRVEDRIRTLK